MQPADLSCRPGRLSNAAPCQAGGRARPAARLTWPPLAWSACPHDPLPSRPDARPAARSRLAGRPRRGPGAAHPRPGADRARPAARRCQTCPAHRRAGSDRPRRPADHGSPDHCPPDRQPADRRPADHRPADHRPADRAGHAAGGSCHPRAGRRAARRPDAAAGEKRTPPAACPGQRRRADHHRHLRALGAPVRRCRGQCRGGGRCPHARQLAGAVRQQRRPPAAGVRCRLAAADGAGRRPPCQGRHEARAAPPGPRPGTRRPGRPGRRTGRHRSRTGGTGRPGRGRSRPDRKTPPPDAGAAAAAPGAVRTWRLPARHPAGGGAAGGWLRHGGNPAGRQLHHAPGHPRRAARHGRLQRGDRGHAPAGRPPHPAPAHGAAIRPRRRLRAVLDPRARRDRGVRLCGGRDRPAVRPLSHRLRGSAQAGFDRGAGLPGHHRAANPRRDRRAHPGRRGPHRAAGEGP